jgi:hypothetical protein
MSQTPDTSTTGGTAEHVLASGHPHNFDIQKDVHREIRNDPDYDDWEYGTEPLPHEAWIAAQAAAAEAAAAAAAPKDAGSHQADATDNG